MDGGQFTLIGSTTCVMLTLRFSIQLVSQHYLSWKTPKEQKAIVVIVLMAPLYALDSYLGLIDVQGSSTFLEFVKECYEALPHTVRLDHKKLKLLKNWTWQFVVIRPVCSVLMIALQLLVLYPSWLSWTFIVILNVSVSLALYSLALFRHVFAKELEPHMCIKDTVFFSFWQGIMLDILVAMGVVKSNYFWLDVEHLEEALQNVLVIVEMVFFSLLMRYAYTAEPYLNPSSVSQISSKKKER